MRRLSSRRRAQWGGVLVQALIVLAGLTTLLAALAADQHTLLESTQRQLRTRRAEMAARAAVQRALAVFSTAPPAVVTQTDDWYTLCNSGNTAFDLGGSTFRMEIIDAGARININTATQNQLQLLPITQEQLDSLLDWRSTGQTARADGAKDAYYNALTPPYNTKLGALTTMSELLLVKGWTAQALFGTQTDIISTAVALQDANGRDLPLISVLTTENGTPNQRSNGAPRVNLNVRNINANTFAQMGVTGGIATQLASRAPFPSFQALLRQPGITTNTAQRLLDAATFTPGTRLTGKINLNTAPAAVLETVPGVTSAIANAIVDQQTTGFRSLSDLSTVPGANVPLLAQIADAFTVGSDTFLVRAYGESGGVGVALEVTIGIRNNRPQILNWERLPDVSIPAWWNWQETPDSTIDAGSQP